MQIISRYFVVDTPTGEYMRLVAQYVFSEEKLIKAVESARKTTTEFINKGNYISRQEVYLHPNGARKPWTHKKIDISPLVTFE